METYFVAPVRLCVDGQELLAWPELYRDWRPLPVLGLASGLRDLVLALEHGQVGCVFLADGGELKISRDRERLVFSSTLLPVRASASRDEVIPAVLAFSHEACVFAQLVAPTVALHPEWSGWCPGPT